jgi:hypothetical protein
MTQKSVRSRSGQSIEYAGDQVGNLRPNDGITLRARNFGRSLVQQRQEHACEKICWIRFDNPRIAQRRKHPAHCAECVTKLYLAPCLRTDDLRGLDEGYPLDIGCRAKVDQLLESNSQTAPRVTFISRGRGGKYLGFQLLCNRLEEAFLAGEMMVDGAGRDSRIAGNPCEVCPRIAFSREVFSGDSQQSRPGRLQIRLPA